jgi:hypothetical protein
VSGRDNDGEAPIAALLASPAATPLGHSRATTSKLLYVKIGRAFGQQLSDIANLTNGRFAPQAAVSRFQLDREGSPKTTSPRDSAAAIHHHSRTCREQGGCLVQYRVRNIGRFSDAPDWQSLRYAGKHCLAFGFCHAGPQWSRDQSGRDCVHSDWSEFKRQAARQRLECGVDGAERYSPTGERCGSRSPKILVGASRAKASGYCAAATRPV